jgi:hypothetical protein
MFDRADESPSPSPTELRQRSSDVYPRRRLSKYFAKLPMLTRLAEDAGKDSTRESEFAMGRSI